MQIVSPQMHIASHCQHRAMLLLQIAQEHPEFRERAVYLAREWLNIAAVRITCLHQIEHFEKGGRTN